MTRDERISKLKNGSDTAIWAANEIEMLTGLLLWALYHHQGGGSTIGQPIRKALGIGEYDRLTSEQIKEAQIAGGVIVTPNK